MQFVTFQPFVLLLTSALIAPNVSGTTLKTTALLLPSESNSSFDKAVKPLLMNTCRPCHNAQISSGGLNLDTFMQTTSIEKYRENWELILQKVSAGEMPPRGITRPPKSHIDFFINFVEKAFEHADRSMPIDPGRVTTRRLNRNEYSNTIRDLLGVSFRVKDSFPSDDSGYGFDNIGDVLTISPLLMEKYVAAAEWIAAAAFGGNSLPDKPLEATYSARDGTIIQLTSGSIETTHRIEWDGEYIIRIGLPGERPPGSPPVRMNLHMNGKLIHSTQVETTPTKLVYFSPRSIEEMRLHLEAGDHTFQVSFADDNFVSTLCKEDLYNRKKNKFLESISFVGPFPTDVENLAEQNILICDPNSGDQCVYSILSRFARRAYRRPVIDKEVASLVKFVKQAQREGQPTERGLQLAIQTILISPHFLFRIEHDSNPIDPAEIHPISNTELASRLSYFLWSSTPDDELLSLAETGDLRDSTVLASQVNRMLLDKKSAALAVNFGGQWLETRNLDSVIPDTDKFPAWDPGLRKAMQTETQLFFEAMLRENRPLFDFLDARFTFLNDRLASHYGIADVEGPHFRRVSLNTDKRGGVLTQAAVLTVTSYPTRTSPVLRGKFLLKAILGAPPPPPPANVPALEESNLGVKGTLREQLEQHRSNPACASCHDRMDTLGFGLENYDAIGRWRERDGDFLIDSGGTLPSGKSFSGPAELRKILSDDRRSFIRTVTEKMLTYALGRGLESYDRKALVDIMDALGAEGYTLQSLIHEVVRSVPFQMRRGENNQRLGKKLIETIGQ